MSVRLKKYSYRFADKSPSGNVFLYSQKESDESQL